MPIYSHSRLSTFETCPLRYKFGYIDKIEREKEGIEAFLGSRFHEAMEMLYKDLKFKVYSLQELLEFYEMRWDKEAVIKYAEKEKIEVIRGSGNKLKITEKQKVSCPSKGSQERQELESILRQANKWDEVSDLDTFALRRAISEGKWDKKILDKIKQFLKIETKKSISLSKIQEKEK